MTKPLSHVSGDGSARMVDVGRKDPTQRTARAAATVILSTEAFQAVKENRVKKGAVLEVARLAGISAAKQTSSLIPLCHPLSLTKIVVDFTLVGPNCIEIETTVEAIDRTGVEMEAMTAASVAALTVYDMCKAIDREIRIHKVRLLEKHGGKSGSYVREEGET